MRTLQTLAERVADTNKTPLHPAFVNALRTIANNENWTEDEVWTLWEKYVHDCRNMDQSPVMFEFCQWNNFKVVSA